ncbi:hypothetical protein TNCV_4424851 [Trichonephila clavipes]|nr:hypothetical protein TNCV_4424851 [Trichonephila clavipes]
MVTMLAIDLEPSLLSSYQSMQYLTKCAQKSQKDYNDDHRDEINDFDRSIRGFQECDEDIETWMAIDAEDSVDFKC